MLRPVSVHPGVASGQSFEQAAALPLGGVTAYRAAFTRARLQPGERVQMRLIDMAMPVQDLR